MPVGLGVGEPALTVAVLDGVAVALGVGEPASTVAVVDGVAVALGVGEAAGSVGVLVDVGVGVAEAVISVAVGVGLPVADGVVVGVAVALGVTVTLPLTTITPSTRLADSELSETSIKSTLVSASGLAPSASPPAVIVSKSPFSLIGSIGDVAPINVTATSIVPAMLSTAFVAGKYSRPLRREPRPTCTPGRSVS